MPLDSYPTRRSSQQYYELASRALEETKASVLSIHDIVPFNAPEWGSKEPCTWSEWLPLFTHTHLPFKDAYTAVQVLEDVRTNIQAKVPILPLKSDPLNKQGCLIHSAVALFGISRCGEHAYTFAKKLRELEGDNPIPIHFLIIKNKGNAAINHMIAIVGEFLTRKTIPIIKSDEDCKIPLNNFLQLINTASAWIVDPYTRMICRPGEYLEKISIGNQRNGWDAYQGYYPAPSLETYNEVEPEASRLINQYHQQFPEKVRVCDMPKLTQYVPSTFLEEPPRANAQAAAAASESNDFSGLGLHGVFAKSHKLKSSLISDLRGATNQDAWKHYPKNNTLALLLPKTDANHQACLRLKAYLVQDDSAVQNIRLGSCSSKAGEPLWQLAITKYDEAKLQQFLHTVSLEQATASTLGSS